MIEQLRQIRHSQEHGEVRGRLKLDGSGSKVTLTRLRNLLKPIVTKDTLMFVRIQIETRHKTWPLM